MPKLWFIADTHWGHGSIIRFCYRPFQSLFEMDDALIKNWNAVVGPNDLVYHLGDVAFQKPDRYLNNLNGEMFLIAGNHDKGKVMKHPRWRKVVPYMELTLQEHGKQKIVLSHYAFETWNKAHWGA